MEFFDRIRERFAAKPSVVRKYEKETRDFTGTDPSSLSDNEWWHLESAVRERDTNAFKELGIEDNPENRVKVISSYLHASLGESWPELVNQSMELNWGAGEDIQQAEHVFNTIFTDLGFLIEGRKFDITSQFFDKDNSYRHSERTAWISEVILEEIWERSNNTDQTARQTIGEISKRAIYPAGFLHDIGRLVTHGSKHDEYGDEILKRAGIRAEVIGAIHSPVMFSPNVEDLNSQKIVRLADVFAKVAENENGEFLLRGSVDEVSKYSLERQTGYWEREHKNPESYWFGKSMDDVKKYIDEERVVLEISEKWLQSMGINLGRLIEKINGGIRGNEGNYYRGRP